jgi:hypothetical protein
MGYTVVSSSHLETILKKDVHALICKFNGKTAQLNNYMDGTCSVYGSHKYISALAEIPEGKDYFRCLDVCRIIILKLQ